MAKIKYLSNYVFRNKTAVLRGVSWWQLVMMGPLNLLLQLGYRKLHHLWQDKLSTTAGWVLLCRVLNPEEGGLIFLVPGL